MRYGISAKEFLNEISKGRPESSKNKAEMLFNISSMIIDYRLENNLTQKQLAEFLEVTQGMVSKWESGEYNFSISQVCKIAEKLNMTPELTFSNNKCNTGNCWEESENISPFDDGWQISDCA